MESGAQHAEIIASYQVSDVRPRQMQCLLAGLLIVSASLAVFDFVMGGGYVWLAGIGLLAADAMWSYLPLWRWPYRLDLTASELRWRTLARRGAIPLTDLMLVRQDNANRDRVVLQTSSGQRIRVAGTRQMRSFLSVLQQRAPHVVMPSLVH
jgi:hypothetical protein